MKTFQLKLFQVSILEFENSKHVPTLSYIYSHPSSCPSSPITSTTHLITLHQQPSHSNSNKRTQMADQAPAPPQPTTPITTPTRRTPSDVWREIEDGYINPPPLSPRRLRLQEQIPGPDTPPGFPGTSNHHKLGPKERHFESPDAQANSPPRTPPSQRPSHEEEEARKQYPQRSPSSIWRGIRSGYGPDYNSNASSSPLENTGGVTHKGNSKGSASSSNQRLSLVPNTHDSHPQPTCPIQPKYYQSIFREHFDGFPPAQAKKPPRRGLITGGGAGGRRDVYYDDTLGEWRAIPPIHVDTDSESEKGSEKTEEEDGVGGVGGKREKRENKLKKAVNCVVGALTKGREDKDDEPDQSDRLDGPIEKPIFGFESIY